MKRIAPLLEVTVVIALFLYLRPLFRSLEMRDWELSVFGATPLTSILLFFGLPLVFVLATQRNPGTLGLTTQQLGYHSRVAMRALSVVAPVTILFPVIFWLGSDHKQLLGATILTTGFALGGWMMIRLLNGMRNAKETTITISGFLAYIALLAVGLVVTGLLNTFSPLLARLVMAMLFVGFMEELFFRGYIQARLNKVFGRPFRVYGVNCGAGLILTAAIFGLMHPLTSPDELTPWPWALWTAMGGLIFGYLREKTAAFVAPALVHGVILLPGVLFGP